MAFDKVRFVSTNNKILLLLLSVLLGETKLNQLFDLCGMVVYKVDKSNVFMPLQTYWDLEFKVFSKSFEFFNIHIWLTPLLE